VNLKAITTSDGWGLKRLGGVQDWSPADWLLRVVDVGLALILCAAPFFFGGRHDFGRFLLLFLIALTSVAWCARQALLPTACWKRTVAYAIPLLAAGLLVLQLLPLPSGLLAWLSPRTMELLPLWTPGAPDAASLGTWHTISLIPHETAKSLAMLVGYGLLFAVVVERIESTADIERLLQYLAAAATLMAAFGIAQYYTSDGRFFWFFSHPWRTTENNITGAFINRNHFASFLVLGLGPLVACLLACLRPLEQTASQAPQPPDQRQRILVWSIAAAIVVVALAILGSRSRGGSIVMLVTTGVLAFVYIRRGLVDRRFVYGLAGLAALVLGVLSFHGLDEVTERLDDFAEGSIDAIDHNAIRRKVWSANLQAIQASWLTGTGAGSHREICPVYLPESLTKEYTHAENGYLQVATENGIFGLALVVATIAICGAWCNDLFRSARSTAEIRCFGAIAAALAASLVHSLVDFVWYIPACMCGTIVLVACLARLSQIVQTARGLSPFAESSEQKGTVPLSERNNETNVPINIVLPRSRWIQITAAAAVLGGWSAASLFGPGVAAIHWDRYLRTANLDSQLSQQEFSDFLADGRPDAQAMRRGLSEQMLRHIERAINWDPQFARAHRRIADRYMAEFEHRMLRAANQLDITQIRDAAFASSFRSQAELRQWLNRAFGPDLALLQSALDHAHRAVELCPLQGDSYLHLADLCFLERRPREAVAACVNQSLLVRPYDKHVLTRAGLQQLLLGNAEAAVEHWSRCFNTPGRHQKEIVYRLVSCGMPARLLLDRMQPQWRTLREIWPQYRQIGSREDLAELLAYAAQAAQRETEKAQGIPAATVWHWQASLHTDVGQTSEALSCLNQAYVANPHSYLIRYSLGKTLLAAGRPNEAEPHVRWCLARRPEDKWLHDAIETISRLRFAEYSARPTPRTATLPPLPPVVDPPWRSDGGSRSEQGEGALLPLPKGVGLDTSGAEPISR
jgi:O-antigen ligase/tetratricopeptide (TPR) repeat protein